MKIQCPECSQRFNTTEDFIGKTVECGACDHQFKVLVETMVSEQIKVFPGEAAVSDLSGFETMTSEAKVTPPFRQAQYSKNVNLANVEPLKPRRILAILVGISIFIFVAVVFLFAGGKNGSLQDVVTLHRYLLVGFASLVAGSLLIFGMRKDRSLGVFLAFVFGAVLLSIPYFLPGAPAVGSSEGFANKKVIINGGGSIVINEQDIQRDYLMEVGYGPIEKALEKGAREQVIGIFLRGANRLLGSKVTESLYESNNKLDRGVVYGREDAALLLLTKQTMSIQELADLCGEFGEVIKVSEELRLIDMKIENDVVTSNGSAAFDESDRAFYTDNLLTLSSIGRAERLSAIKRLGNSEPLAHKPDIVKKLIELLPNGDVEEQLAIVKTLRTWSKPGEGAEPVVLLAAQNLYEKGELDSNIMEFLIERNVDEGFPILMKLWEANPVNWSELLINMGTEAESLILPKITTVDGIQFSSACRILKKVGTAESLAVLTGLLDTKSGQNKKTLKATIDEIKKRL